MGANRGQHFCRSTTIFVSFYNLPKKFKSTISCQNLAQIYKSLAPKPKTQSTNLHDFGLL